MPDSCDRESDVDEEEAVFTAVDEVLSQEGAAVPKSLRSIALKHRISRSALSRRVTARKAGTCIAARAGRQPKLGKFAEDLLKAWIIRENDLHISPTLDKVASKAAQLAGLQDLCFDNAGENRRRPTRKWVRRFMQRHNLSFRKPVPYSSAKQKAATNRPAITGFMQQLKGLLQQQCGSTGRNP